MEEFERKRVVVSLEFLASVNHILTYGEKVFGIVKSIEYKDLIFKKIAQLETLYHIHAEHPYLATKNKIYRRIVLPSHIIIYRIKGDSVEVLDILHQSSSIKRTAEVKKYKL